jgi:hypothetical protein
MGIQVVDQFQALGVAEDGSVVLEKKILARAKKLGRRITEAMDKPTKQLKFMGEETATCPVCHTNLMIVGKNSPIECAVCGIAGEIKVNNGKISVVFPKSEIAISRYTDEGKRIHHFETWDVLKKLEPRLHELPAKLEKYQAYEKITLPPSKKK